MNRASVQSSSSALMSRLGNGHQRARGTSSVLIVMCVSAVSFILGTHMSHQSNTRPSLAGTAVFGTSEVTSSSSTTIAVDSAPARTHQILVFGDSLTSGVSGNHLFPYSRYLEQVLEKEGVPVHVRTLGLPGWTTRGMVKGLDGAKGGLRTAIQSFTNSKSPPLSLVIVLAGTNDLKKPKVTADEITANLLRLHTVICQESAVPQSLAIAIPPSALQADRPPLATLVATVNENMRLVLGSDDYPNTTLVEFPFDYEQEGVNWHSDGLHFSEQGYRVLGESLAPVVVQILKALESSEDDTDDRR